MSRPLRLEFPGAIYHVTSRGDRREPIYRGDADRADFLEILDQATDRFDAQLLAYCLMGNHYHLVLHTRSANLSRFMRHLNGVYTQSFNHRHGLVGHLLQGRFKAILVDRDAYLLALCRYVERNPVAAGLVRSAGEWPWSSYRAHVLRAEAPPWLDCDGLHGYLLGHAPRSEAERADAASRYAAMVEQAAAADADLWQRGLRQQVFLGDEHFVERMLAQAPAGTSSASGVPKRQTRRPRSAASTASLLSKLAGTAAERAEAMRAAYVEGGRTMTDIAQACGLSVSRVSRLIAQAERAGEMAVGAVEAKGKT